ncbi:MAG: FG-GAP-like repeat-containing protein [Planctomycetota bacterium]|nr:FG-GAP-like repeat-containing protein [Planctomycetota bacterium]
MQSFSGSPGQIRPRFASVAAVATIAAFAASCPAAVADGPFLLLPTVISPPTPAALTMVATGDLDGDGDPDLVLTGRNADGLAFVSINDQGVFGEPQPLEIGGQADYVEIADLDGDDRPDLIFAVRSFRGRLAVLRGLGDGTFREPEEIRLGREPRCVLARDLDGDGDIDLAGLNHREPVIEILVNDGTGRFDRRPSVVVGGAAVGIPYPQAMEAGDLDGDGDLDLAIVCTGESRVHVALNRGDATFDAPSGWRPVRVAGEIGGMSEVRLGDLDLDGDLDVVVPLILLDSPSHLGMYSNRSDANGADFDREVAAPSTDAGYAFTVALADLDGDGDLDAITGHAIPGPLTVLDNRLETPDQGGDGIVRFEPAQVVAIDSFFRDVTAVDIDGDCDLDVVAIDLVANAIWVLRNETPQGNGCGSPGVPRSSGSSAATARTRPSRPIDPSTVADLDGDGRVDGGDLALLLSRIGADPDPETDR